MEESRWTKGTGAVRLDLDPRPGHDRVPGPGGAKVWVHVVERKTRPGCSIIRAGIWLHAKNRYGVTLYEGRGHKDRTATYRTWDKVRSAVDTHLAKIDDYLERERTSFRMPGLKDVFKKPVRSGKEPKRGDLVVLKYPIEAYLIDEQISSNNATYRCPQVVEGQLGVVLKKEDEGYYVQYGEGGSNYNTFEEDEFETIDNVGLEALQMWHYYKDEVEADPIYHLGLKHGEEDGKQKLFGTIRKNIQEILKGLDTNLAAQIFGRVSILHRGSCGIF